MLGYLPYLKSQLQVLRREVCRIRGPAGADPRGALRCDAIRPAHGWLGRDSAVLFDRVDPCRVSKAWEIP
jgi:hypothetical protein